MAISKKDQERILAEAAEEGKRWLEIVTFDKASVAAIDKAKIKSELEQMHGNPTVVVVDNQVQAKDAIYNHYLDLMGGDKKKAGDKIKEMQPHLCIWDYYLMAFYESSYHRLPEQTHPFMKHSLFEAVKAGLGMLVNLDDFVVGITRPEAYRDEEFRLHKEDGPAYIQSGMEPEFWWHGIQVPRQWIEKPETCTKEDFIGVTNQEQKRAFCEILGWDKVLDMVGCKKIQSDDWGDLLETKALDDDDGHPARFADVRCPSTGRRYLIRTSPDATTCREALAKSAKIEADEYEFEAES